VPPTLVVPRPPRTAAPVPTDPTPVPAPPGAEDGAAAQSWVQTALLAGGGLGGLVFMLVNPRPLYVFAGCVLVVLTAGGAAGYAVAQRRSGRRRRLAARTRYLARLGETRDRATATAAARRAELARAHPAPDRLAALARGGRTFHRRPGDPEFLAVRLGTGRLPAAGRPELPAVDPTGTDPLLLDRARRLVDTLAWADGLPVTLDLAAVRRLVVRPAAATGVPRALLAQAVSVHTPADLRVVVGVRADRAADWEWAKWLPHAAGPVLLTDPARLEALVRAELAGPAGPHLLVVCDGLALSDDGALSELAEVDAGSGCTVVEVRDGPVWWADVELRPDPAGGATLTGPRAPVTDGPVTPDTADPAGCARLARRLAACRPAGAGEGGAAGPTRTRSLPELLGVPDLAGLDRDAAWAPRPDRDRLRVPVGLTPAGAVVHLDLKEAAAGGMGPHGLLVGATGSGKSELLRTLVTGLALGHPPEDLSFVLVDFKGGAAFAGLAGLPHVAGLITNLQGDATLVARAHDALHGELLRRQQVLSDAGRVSSLADYRALRADRPDLPALPTLMVIVDEFSELLQQHPDFAELFAAVGRLGRSLGIHLLVASQRLEEGRLRGLESHLSYRIALRTFGPADSVTAIGVRDAHSLPRSPGSAYLSLGAGDLRRFDAAHVSAVHRPGDGDGPGGPRVLPYRARPRPLPGRPAADPAAGGERTFEVVARRLRADDRRTHQVWLPPLPRAVGAPFLLGEVSVHTDRGLHAPRWTDPERLLVPLAVVDRPREQGYASYALDLGGTGAGALVVGGPRSGRSTAVATLVLGLALTTTPAESQVYVLDLGGGLRGLAGLPHVGAVAARTDTERVVATVGHVQAVLAARETAFAEHGVDSVEHLRRRRAEGSLPGPDWADVLLVVDGLAELRGDHPDLEPALAAIAARGPGYGVHLVATATRWGDVRPQLRELLPGRLELRLTEPAESAVDRAEAARVPADRPGRGLVSPGLHVQVLLPRLDDGDPAAAGPDGLAAAVAAVRRHATGPAAPPVRTLPHLVTPADLAALPAPGGIPVGVTGRGLGAAGVDLSPAEPHLLVLGDSGSGRTSVLRTVVDGLLDRGADGHAVYLVDFRRTLAAAAEDPRLAAYAPTPAAVTELVAGLVELLAARMPRGRLTRQQLRDRSWWTGPEEYVVVDDADLLESSGVSPLAPLADFVPHAADLGLHLVLARRVAGASRALAGPLYGRLRDFGAQAVILSGDRHEGPLVGGVRAEERRPGRGTLVRRGRPAELVQTVWRPEPSLD
jgi:DNA segregation ATPase FtsK/SpoIIIE, S-DNA-T family